MNIKKFWKDVLEQNKDKLQEYFKDKAILQQLKYSPSMKTKLSMSSALLN